MTSAEPPNPWFSTINFNEAFFASNTQTITLAYANATYLKRIGIATSVASTTTFNGDVGITGNLTLTKITYSNATSQITAYTGGTAGTYTTANITLDANGKISSIANGSTPTLANVLIAGNSAGATSINMNSNAITSISNVATTTLTATGIITASGNIALPTTTPSIASGQLGQIIKVFGNTVGAVVPNATITPLTSTATLVLPAGVYTVQLYFFANLSGVVGSYLYTTLGLSTSNTTLDTNGFQQNASQTTCSIPATAGFINSQAMNAITVPSGGRSFFLMVQIGIIGSSATSVPANCYANCIRIA
jgi:hypothetical protein